LQPKMLSLALVAVALVLVVGALGAPQVRDPPWVLVEWAVYVNPTGGVDSAYGVCTFDDYVVAVGAAGASSFSAANVIGTSVEAGWPAILQQVAGRPYVVFLRKSDGEVVGEWVGSERGELYNCASAGGRLYVVGTVFLAEGYQGVVLAFGRNLSPLGEARGGGGSDYYSLAYWGGALYIGGAAYEDVDGDGRPERVWLVEKRNASDLSLVASRSFRLGGSWLEGAVFDIGVEPSTGMVWAVGFYRDEVGWHSLIVVFDSGLGEVAVVDLPEGAEEHLGVLHGVAFDGWGHAYVSGRLGAARLGAGGELVVVKKSGRVWDKVAYAHNHLFAFRVGVADGYLAHFLDVVNPISLDVVWSVEISRGSKAGSTFSIGKPAVEGSRVYVAGGDYSLGGGDTRIAVYSLLVRVDTEAGTGGATASTTPAPMVGEAPTNATATALATPREGESPPSLPLGAFIDTTPAEIMLVFVDTKSPAQVVATWLSMAVLALLVARMLLRS